MSLSRKAQYKINKFKSLSSPKPAPLLQVGKAFAFKSKITFFAISAASWTMCGAYAYYVWTHKEPKEINDNPKSQLAVKEEEVNVKQNIQPKFAKYKSKLFEKNDEPVEYYVSNNPKVVQNDELSEYHYVCLCISCLILIASSALVVCCTIPKIACLN